MMRQCVYLLFLTIVFVPLAADGQDSVPPSVTKQITMLNGEWKVTSLAWPHKAAMTGTLTVKLTVEGHCAHTHQELGEHINDSIIGWNPAPDALVESGYTTKGSNFEYHFNDISEDELRWHGTALFTPSGGETINGKIRLEWSSPNSFVISADLDDYSFMRSCVRVDKSTAKDTAKTVDKTTK